MLLSLYLYHLVVPMHSNHCIDGGNKWTNLYLSSWCMYYNECSLQVHHPIRNAQVLTHCTETAERFWPHGCPQVTYGQNKSRKQYATSITIHQGVQKRGGVDPIVIRIIILGLLHWPKKYCFQQTLGATAAVNIADIGDLEEYHKCNETTINCSCKLLLSKKSEFVLTLVYML